jgi:hypothetical protein
MQSQAVTTKTRHEEAGRNKETHSEQGRISIWFFIGVLLLVYGVLILGAGIHDRMDPPAQQPVLAELHAGIWWGGLIMILGGIYSYRFFPRKDLRKDR